MLDPQSERHQIQEIIKQSLEEADNDLELATDLMIKKLSADIRLKEFYIAFNFHNLCYNAVQRYRTSIRRRSRFFHKAENMLTDVELALSSGQKKGGPIPHGIAKGLIDRMETKIEWNRLSIMNRLIAGTKIKIGYATKSSLNLGIQNLYTQTKVGSVDIKLYQFIKKKLPTDTTVVKDVLNEDEVYSLEADAKKNIGDNLRILLK